MRMFFILILENTLHILYIKCTLPSKLITSEQIGIWNIYTLFDYFSTYKMSLHMIAVCIWAFFNLFI